MEKLKYIFTGLLILFLCVSCSEDFLERLPYGQLSPETFYATDTDAEYATNACYQQLRNLNGFWAGGYRAFGNYWTDDLSAESMWTGYILGDVTPADKDLVTGSWRNAYRAIARCNSTIEGIEGMTDEMIEADEKADRLAEVRFIRGFFYFRLVRLFGDVPLILEPVDAGDDASLYPARTAAADIYSQAVLPDLEFAVANLPASYASLGDANRITSGAANAYLCLVHLTLGNWAEAATYGKAVESSGEYMLLDDFAHIHHEFYEFNEESIFEISYSKSHMNWNSKYYGTRDGNLCRGATYFAHSKTSMDLRDAFSLSDGSAVTDDPNGIYDDAKFWENRDPRFDFTFFTPLDTAEDKNGNIVGYNIEWVIDKATSVDIQKHTLWYGDDVYQVGLNMVEMRYAEVLLNIAEALIMQGQFAEAAGYINQVRARARNFSLADPGRYNQAGLADELILPDITISDQADGMAKLRYEKRIELTSEDVRGYDLRRWGIEEQTWAAVQGFSWNPKLTLLPVPQDALDGNSNLTQNPGW